jgi:hypothetical protein
MTRDEFLNRVMPELPGCPVPMVMGVALEVLEDFCDRTRAWAQTLDPIELVTGQAVYSVDVPSGSRLLSIRLASGPQMRVTPRTRTEMAGIHPGWEAQQGSDPVHMIVDIDASEIRVYPIPSVDGKLLRLDVELCPFGALQMLPDGVMRRYSTAIVSGVKARLMAKPKKSWSSPEMVGYYTQVYEDAVSRVIVDRHTRGAAGDLIVPPVPFGGVTLR